MEHIKFSAIMTAMLAETENKSVVDSVNNILRKYNEILNPAIKKDRKDFAHDAQSILDDALKNFGSIAKRLKNG